MTPEQLAALLAAGLITPDQLAIAQIVGTAPELRVNLPATSVRLADDEQAPPAEDDDEAGGAREIIATVAVYGQLVESHNLILDAGSLEPRDIARRQVKVLRDHNHSDPLGYLTALDPSSLEATLYIAPGDNGDRALTEARDGLRDGVSVGFGIREYAFDDDDVLHVIRAELYEVSLVAIPAIADAGVISVTAAIQNPTTPKGNILMNREQLAAALAAGTITQAEHDAALAVLVARENPAPAELAAGPQVVQLAAGPASTEDRPRSLSQVSREIAELAERRDLPGIMLALNTHVVADDPGTAFYGRPDWIGEIWQAQPTGRPWIESFGSPSPLTSGKIQGFILEDRENLRPQKYAGGGAEIATGKMKTKKVEAAPERWAFGTTLDRIFVDLGTEDLVASLFKAIAAGYDVVSDINVATAILAAATRPTTPAADPEDDPDLVIDTSVLQAIARGAADLRKIGAHVDHIKMGEGAFEEWSEQKIADLPAWLANQLGFVDLREGTSEIGDLRIEADIRMEDDEIAIYDKRAATVYESPQIQLEAINIPNGKIDIGFFTYGGLLVADARAIELRTVVLS